MNNMSYAVRFLNAIKISVGDSEMEQLVEQEFEKIRMTDMYIDEENFALTVFNDLSSIIKYKTELLVSADPEELMRQLYEIAEHNPRLLRRFEQQVRQKIADLG